MRVGSLATPGPALVHAVLHPAKHSFSPARRPARGLALCPSFQLVERAGTLADRPCVWAMGLSFHARGASVHAWVGAHVESSPALLGM